MGSGALGKKIAKQRKQEAGDARYAPRSVPRRRAKRLDPKERAWAHAYLRHIAELHRLPYDGARESMQLLTRHFGLDMPEGDGAARRSSVAILLAKAIQAETGIELPNR